jgi:hypothetical protein
MGQKKSCDPMDMIAFLLALCCRKDSSPAIDSREDDLDKRLEDCFQKVIPIAEDGKLKRKLED